MQWKHTLINSVVAPVNAPKGWMQIYAIFSRHWKIKN